MAFDVALIACPVMQFYCGTPMYLLSGVDTLVIREGSSDRLIFNYEDYVKGKNLEKNLNFFLQDGDTVFVKD